jgi:ribosomal protein L40E
MGNYQEQKKAGQKEQEQTSRDDQNLAICPNCNAEVPEDALFCPECRFALKQRICPKCGKGNPMSADICQFCHTWLLENQCKFCYAKLSQEDQFCPECGKPQAGLPCPKCGQISIFDFCKNCGTPVTKEAIAEISAAKAEIVKPTSDAQLAQTAAIQAQIIRPETIINSEPEQDDSKLQRLDVVNEEDEHRKQQRQAQAQKEAHEKQFTQLSQAVLLSKEEAMEQAKENAKKKFSTPQAARRWHLARRHPDAIGWLCNYAEVVHLYSEGGPDDCHDPSKGGCDYFGEIEVDGDGFNRPKK